MRAPKVYGLILGLTIVATADETASSAGRPAVAAASDETWTIPGAASIAGLNNTRFVSDLALTNLGSSTANVIVSFVGPGDLPPKPITLAAGATTVYRNVLDALWAASGLVGALSVRSDQPLVLRARTYNTAATGTFGVALPVYASGQLLAEGQTADSFWVQQDPSGSSGFRTNVGVVFPDAGGGDAVVTFYDASGGVVGTLNYSSASAGFQQLSIASVTPAGLLVGRAQISVTRGHAAGYAVGADNVTGDTSLYPFEALPAGVQDVVVNGVARLNGRNNTFFRTDARFYNPTPGDVTVTVRFHAAGAANPTPQSATLNLPAGRIVEVVDVLGTILSAPVGSGGALRFTADQPVAILCRTSNVDPQGVQPGTFGAQQHPVPLASFLSSADAGAVVTAIRQDTSFRTNVGFTAGADGAAYRLTLKSAQGTAIATAAGSLGAFGWTQASVADLFPGTGIPADATLLVEVTSGTVDVYDASADNASGDLVVTPSAPVPADIPPSATIGPSGGSIRSADGRLTLKVPAGALATPMTLSIAPTANGAPQGIGSAYALSPVGLAFAGPAQVVFAYSTEDLDGTGEGALGLAIQDGSNWFGISGGSIDPVARTLSVPVSSTSPAPAPTGQGLGPQHASASGNLAPYGAVSIVPESVVLPVGGRKSFALGFVGPSSTESRTPGFFALAGGLAENVTTIWYVNGVVDGNASEGTVASAGNNATYMAPRCKPPINPVYLAVFVKVVGRPNSTSIAARVRIIEKDWRIQVQYDHVNSCAFGTYLSFSYYRDMTGRFSLDDDARVTGFVPNVEPPNNITNNASWCPGFQGECTELVADEIGELVVTALRGEFRDTFSSLGLLLEVDARIPGRDAYVHFTCGTPHTLLIPHGAPAEITQEFLLLSPDFLHEIEYANPGSGVVETALVFVEPIKPDGCP